jgi:hypothetical protein
MFSYELTSSFAGSTACYPFLASPLIWQLYRRLDEISFLAHYTSLNLQLVGGATFVLDVHLGWYVALSSDICWVVDVKSRKDDMVTRAEIQLQDFRLKH